MEQIKSLAQLSPMITAQWKKGVLTNAAFSAQVYEKEIEAGTLYAEELPGALLLLRQREGFGRLNFYLQPGGDLTGWKPEQTTVLEVPFREKDMALRESGVLWDKLGFKLQFSRLRLVFSEKTVPLTEEGSFFIRPAGERDLPHIEALMLSAYDPRTACLPTKDELCCDLKEGNLVVAESAEHRVVAFSRMLKNRRNAEWRHLVVAPECRGQNIAQRLFAYYVGVNEIEQVRVWVAEKNAAALRLYDKLGFTPDGWTSTVWIYDKERI